MLFFFFLKSGTIGVHKSQKWSIVPRDRYDGPSICGLCSLYVRFSLHTTQLPKQNGSNCDPILSLMYKAPIFLDFSTIFPYSAQFLLYACCSTQKREKLGNVLLRMVWPKKKREPRKYGWTYAEIAGLARILCSSKAEFKEFEAVLEMAKSGLSWTAISNWSQQVEVSHQQDCG